MNKSLIKDNGFECTQCKKIVLDGHKHDNEEDVCDQCKIENLEKQLAITEEALELACDNLEDINFKLYNTEMNFVDFFKQQAKEILENE